MLKTMEKIEFIKMHGLGNDFVILDARAQPIENKEDLSRKLGNRRFGVGCDQIIMLESSDGADVFMRIYNPDGSESGMCGNAARCVADIVLKETQKSSVTIQTITTLLNCVRADNGQVTVDMGEPRLDWTQIPLAEKCDTLNLKIGGGGVSNPVAVSMGNPHCVFFVDDVDAVDVAKLGIGFEYNSIFPERANIEFAEIITKTHIKMRVWERGTGITPACGSGACATAVAAMRRDLTGRKVVVSMDGGDLTLEWRASDNHVYMTGPVAYVFSGVLEDL